MPTLSGKELLWEAYRAGATYADTYNNVRTPSPAAWEAMQDAWYRSFLEFYEVLKVAFPNV